MILQKKNLLPFSYLFHSRKGDLDMFLKLSLPDKPTYFPILPPTEEIIKLSQENAVNFEDFIKPS